MRDWEEYVRRRLSLPALPPERESRIARELGAQLEDFYQDALARGASEAEAEAYAAAQIRDWDGMARDLSLAEEPNKRPRLDRWSEAAEESARGRAGKGGSLVADVLSDTRYAVRELVKNPGFAAVALCTLAIGIGATSAVFSVIEAVLLRPLPYAEPERLVRLYETLPRFGRFSVAPANFLDWERESAAFESIAAFSAGSATLTGGDAAERVPTVDVSHGIFQVLGVSPALGREFRPEEDAPGKNAVLILSHGAWQRRHGGDPSILGRTLTLNGLPVTVVGVMPPDFYFPTRATEYWTPLALDPANASRGAHYLGVVARLAPETSISLATAEMRTLAERLASAYPQNADESVEIESLHEGVVGSVRASLLTILAAVGLLTLIACGNVANLLLGRASARGKEIAVRAALGASRSRLARQMMVEGAILGLAAGCLGLALAYAAIDPIQRLSAGGIPRADEIAIDGGVLAFTFFVSTLTGMLFSLAPALQGSRARPVEALREGGRTAGSVPAGRARNALITAEVALSVVLLVGASLLLRSFSRLSSVDPGFRPENVLTFSLSLPAHAYPESHDRIQFFDALLERLQSLPRVRSAGMVQALPLRDDYFLSFAVQGRPTPPPEDEPSANYRVVSSGYFESMGIPLKRGRVIDDRDRAESPFVAVVDEEFVRRQFPSEDPIGRGIDIGNGIDGVYEIVGVVGDVRNDGLDLSPHPSMYVPYRQDPFSTMSLLVRADTDPRLLAPDVRDAVRELDGNLPPYAEGALESVLADSLAERRFSMLLLVLFAAVASFLAAVGLYGVVSYAVSRRTREVGLRVAMGAPPTSLIREILGEGMKPALAGVVIGLVAALALSRALEALLFGVTAFDPASYAATAIGLLVVAGIACFVPAWRASRMDPLEALRHE